MRSTVAVVAAAVVWVAGCAGTTVPSGPSDAAVESGPEGCPAAMPGSNEPCSLPAGTECKFDASTVPCGTARCEGGKWQVSVSAMGCPKPPGPDPCKATFDKSCGMEADCAFGIHQQNCCGDTIAIGFARAQTKAFADNEAVCVRTYPGCGCPSLGLTTEEGRPDGGFLTAADVKVTCVGGSCRTSPK